MNNNEKNIFNELLEKGKQTGIVSAREIYSVMDEADIDIDKLNELELERETKIEGVACWIKDLKAEAEALKNEKQALAERQKVAENKAESLKKWLAYALQGEKFKTPKCAISFRKSEAVEVTDEGLNNLMKEHDELLTYKAPEPNKTAIKQAIKDGLNVAGVQLVQNISTIIK